MTAGPATSHVLDNVVWHALRGRQAGLAEWETSGRAARFDPEVSIFAAVRQLDDEGWAAQAELVGPGGTAILFRDEIPAPPPAHWIEGSRVGMAP